MRTFFEEIGTTVLVCICLFITLGSFIDMFSDTVMQEKGIDFSDGFDVYSYNSDYAEYNYDDPEHSNIVFNLNPIELPYNSDFDWKTSYVDTANVVCTASLNGETIDLKDYIIPKALIGIPVTNIDKVQSKLINTRKPIPQPITFVLKWEGVSIERTIYIAVAPNSVVYTIRGRIGSYEGRSGNRMTRLYLCANDGTEFRAFDTIDTDDFGNFAFTDWSENDYTLKAILVDMNVDGTYTDTVYAYHISKSYFDDALATGSSIIDLGTDIYMEEVHSVVINGIEYLVPIGYTWGEFVDMGYVQNDGEFIVYEATGDPLDGLVMLYSEEPSGVDVDVTPRDYVTPDQIIEEGNYSVAVVKKDTIYNGTRAVSYSAIYRNEE